MTEIHDVTMAQAVLGGCMVIGAAAMVWALMWAMVKLANGPDNDHRDKPKNSKEKWQDAD